MVSAHSADTATALKSSKESLSFQDFEFSIYVLCDPLLFFLLFIQIWGAGCDNSTLLIGVSNLEDISLDLTGTENILNAFGFSHEMFPTPIIYGLYLTDTKSL